MASYKCADCNFRSNTISDVSVHALIHTELSIPDLMNIVADCIVTVRVANKDVLHAVPPTMITDALAYRIASKVHERQPKWDAARFLKLCGVKD